jgi:hypothetical protein
MRLFCDYIYQNRKHDNIGFSRKYDKYEKFLITEYLRNVVTNQIDTDVCS